MNCKDTDGFPKHSNSIFPLLLIFPKMSKPLWLALSLLRQFLSTEIPFSLSNDSREHSNQVMQCDPNQQANTNAPRVTSTEPSTHPILSNRDTNNACISCLDMVDLNILASEAAMCSINISLSCHDSFEFVK